MNKLNMTFSIGLFVGFVLLHFSVKGEILAQCYNLFGYVYYLPTKDAPAAWSDEKLQELNIYSALMETKLI